MMTADEYRTKAEECECKARTGDPALRDVYLAFATEYRHFAEQIELTKSQAQRRLVVRNGCAELVEAMDKGQISVATAIELARLSRSDQIKCLLDEKMRHFCIRILDGEGDKPA